jgi:gamma-glutamylputrescine oxidase
VTAAGVTRHSRRLSCARLAQPQDTERVHAGSLASPLSHWERDALIEHELVIVGGGLIGMSLALEVAAARPSWRIAVLERGLLPSGASTRNAGFACFGSLSELLADAQRMGEGAALELLSERWLGLQALRARFSDAELGYEACGGYELFGPGELAPLDHLERVNALLRPVFGADAYRRADAALARFGFAHTRALVECPLEGALHSGKLAAALQAHARRAGIALLTGARCTGFAPGKRGPLVRIAAPGPGLPALELEARQLALCSNAWIAELCPELGLEPARGQVLLSAPVPDLPFRGTFHFDEGYYYFRHVGERVLFGGGRKLDLTGERSSELELAPLIQLELERVLRERILPGRECRVEARWSGIMGFAPRKQPIVARRDAHSVIAFGCNGMGVALGTRLAQRAARLVLEAG